MKRILATAIWMMINIMPNWLAMRFLDLAIPDWVERARESIKRGRLKRAL